MSNYKDGRVLAKIFGDYLEELKSKVTFFAIAKLLN